MRNLLLFVVVLALAFCPKSNAAESSDPVVSTGFGENSMTGTPVFQVIGDYLYAPGADGIKCIAKGDGAQWTQFAMQGYNVTDFKLSDDEIMATIIPEQYWDSRDKNLSAVSRLVRGKITDLKFTDATPSGIGYTYEGNTLTYLSTIAQHPFQNNRIMITGTYGIYESNDFGKTWEKKSDDYFNIEPHMFFGWHPYDPEIFLCVGYSPMENATVYSSSDNGATWDSALPSPNEETNAYDIGFDPDDNDHLLLSGIDAIYESNDCGATWHNILIADERQILGKGYTLLYNEDETDDLVYYALGQSNDSKLNVIASIDKGKTWQLLFSYDDGGKFYDAALFDGKLWIYDSKDIVYVKLADISGVNTIGMEGHDSDSRTYDLQGKEVKNTLPGNIYIKKGHKYMEGL